MSLFSVKKTLALAGAVVLMMAGAARADSIVYDLTSDHCSGGCGGAGHLFGTITLTDISGGVAMTVSLNDGSKFMSSGLDATVGFNLVGNPTISVTPLPSEWSLNSANAGSVHIDGFGNFDYGLTCCNGQNGAAHAQSGPFTFDIFASGLNIGSFAEVSSGGAPPAYFAVDILSGITGNTGPVDASVPGTPVPDGGSTMMLLGSALFAVGLLRRRFAN